MMYHKIKQSIIKYLINCCEKCIDRSTEEPLLLYICITSHIIDVKSILKLMQQAMTF